MSKITAHLSRKSSHLRLTCATAGRALAVNGYSSLCTISIVWGIRLDTVVKRCFSENLAISACFGSLLRLARSHSEIRNKCTFYSYFSLTSTCRFHNRKEELLGFFEGSLEAQSRHCRQISAST
ncbi:hypothetical protein K439DRAFT_227322 [Ramaria rubella]|nr:hypothetical protein K439DRAFT_227322 [Ramaria rubella]